MHTLFNFQSGQQHGVIRVASWPTTQDTLARGLATFIHYYRNQATSVPSQHLLVKILQSMPVSRDLSTQAYYDAVNNHTTPLSMAMGLTSSFHKGKIFNQLFYGENSSEVIIDDSHPFNPEFADRNWQKLAPLKVVRHDRSQLALAALTGDTQKSPEIAVVSLNLPLLFLQYRAFMNAEKARYGSQDSLKSIMQFVAMYPLPNLQTSHLDFVVFNRALNLLEDKPNERFQSRTPFFQTDYSQRVDGALTELLTRFRSTRLRFEAILRSLPAVSLDSQFDVMRVPHITPTRQVTWALVLSRLNVLRFLFRLNESSDAQENQQEMNRILREAIYYRSDSTLQYGLTPEIYLDVQRTIDELVSMAKQ